MVRGDLLLRPPWRRVFGQAWMLTVLLGSLRAYGILGPESESVRQVMNLAIFLVLL
jgi:hypothetical protein